MIDLRFGRHVLGVCVAVAVLAACGGQASNGVMPATALPNTFPYHKTFNYTGAAQEFKVPAGVTQLKIVLLGGHGAKSAGSTIARGGRVNAVISVTGAKSSWCTLVAMPRARVAASTAGQTAALASAAAPMVPEAAARRTCASIQEVESSWPAGAEARAGPATTAAPARPMAAEAERLPEAPVAQTATRAAALAGPAVRRVRVGGEAAAARTASEATEMAASQVPWAKAVAEGAAARAVTTALAQAVAAVVAAITAVAAEEPAADQSAVTLAATAVVVEAVRPTQSRMPSACKCGETGKSRPVTAWSSSVGSK
jgi:hypothetical protein